MTITMVPSSSPELSMTSSTTPSPSPSIAPVNLLHQTPPPSKVPLDFSPPLIAMVVVVAAAFLIVTYSRLISRYVVIPTLRLFRKWRRRRRRRSESSSLGDIESPPYSFDPSDGFHVFSPYGLDESVIKTIPLSVYTFKKRRSSKSVIREEIRDCAVCLLEFEENEYVRTLPVCSHAFHVDCIDIWLKSHANCPLCRTVILRDREDHGESPFVPLMAARLGLRPSLDDDDGMFESIFLEPLNETEIESDTNSTETEIVPAEASPRRNNFSEDHRFDFALKRSYSFGFERNCASERITTLDQPAMTSPRRYRSSRGGNNSSSFWNNNKRTSPFTKHRVFSFRYRSSNGTIKSSQSPFFRRRSSGFFPLSESNVRYGYGSSNRRSKSMTSPMFFHRSSVSTMFSSSRLRCGDPEALLSPDR